MPPPELTFNSHLAGITFDNVLSGLVGACIGAFTAFLIAWRGRLQTERSKLRALLLKIGHDLYHDGSVPYGILEPQYHDILRAVWDLHAVELPWRRDRLVGLGNALVGHDPKTRNRHCHSYPERFEALDITEDLLTFVGSPFPNHLRKTDMK